MADRFILPPGMPSLLPILNGQASNAGKFLGVVRDDRQPVRERRGCNHQVSCADDVSSTAQVRMPFGVNVGDMSVKRKARKQGAEWVGDLEVLVRFGR